jgi:hypothetical protein
MKRKTSNSIKFSILLLAFPAFLSAQDGNKPCNLKRAVKLLNSLMPESTKTLVKNMSSMSYYDLDRTPKSKLDLIQQWLDDDIEDPKLLIYLRKKGLEYDLASVVLAAFKNSLSGHPFRESEVLNPFVERFVRRNKEDQTRYALDTLDGHYIPMNLDEAIAAMDSFFSDSLRIKVKALTSDEFSARYHLGFGTSLRNRWHLWGGSRLTKWFEQRGVSHGESISGIIIESYHRKLSGHDIDLDGQIKEDQEFWRKSKENTAKREQEELEIAKESFEDEYHVGDTVTYRYRSGYASVEQRNSDIKELCVAKGIVLAKEPKDLNLNVRVLETCDKKGIVRYDNINTIQYDEKLKLFLKPRKRVKIYVIAGKSFWSKFDSWSPSE